MRCVMTPSHRFGSRITTTGHGGVVDAVLADRAEQGLGESAVPAAADNQQLGSRRRGQQHPCSVALGHRGSDLDRLGPDWRLRRWRR